MVIKNYDYNESEHQDYNKEGLSYGEQEEVLPYKQKKFNFLNKMMKSNAFDLGNDLLVKALKSLGLKEKFHELQWWAATIWAQEAMRRLWNHTYHLVGKELIPEYGGCIVVGNHVSHLDPFFISGSIHRPTHWMSKKENFQTPIVRTLFKNLKAFKVDRGTKDQKAWDKAKSLLQNGKIVGMFPEGTRTEDGSMGEFHTGAVRLAIECGVPIVPCAVQGSKNALPKGKLIMKPAKVHVKVGKAIYYTDYIAGKIDYDDAKKLSNELRDVVVDLFEGRNPYEKPEEKPELSIGSPRDLGKKKGSGGLMGKLKSFGKSMLKLIDDSWLAIMNSLEVFDLRFHVQDAIQHFSANTVQALSDLMIPTKYIDYEKYIPKEGGAMVCSNHNSEWDVIILATSIARNGRILYQMAKDSLFKIPVVNAWIRTHHAFPLKRGESDIGSYLYAKDRLEDGQLVVVYPEGTTNNGGGEILPGHTGAVRLAIEAKVPIIPIGITGTENIFPKHAKMINFGKGCILKAGEHFTEHEKFFDSPTPPTYEELKELTDKMMARIKDLMLYDTPGV